MSLSNKTLGIFCLSEGVKNDNQIFSFFFLVFSLQASNIDILFSSSVHTQTRDLLTHLNIMASWIDKFVQGYTFGRRSSKEYSTALTVKIREFYEFYDDEITT